jgi:transposase
MEYGAIDLHMKRSHVRIVSEDGSVIWKGRIDTRRAEFERVFASRSPMRILLESSTESEWVAQTLESMGHVVVVADPNYAAMYGTRNRRIKTDERDVTALGDANRLGVYRAAHRVSAAQRQVRRELRVRSHLVQMRTRTIGLLRALLRQDGFRVPTGSADRHLLAELNTQLAEAEVRVDARANEDAVVDRLMTAPGVGPIVALAFRAVLDDPARFGGDARRVSAFVGVVPSEDSSAERRQKGHITKMGPTELRALLVQASWVIWRGRSPEGATLRAWAHALADRRGRRIAIIALARRLTRILYAMWRDGTDFGDRPRVRVAA